MAHQDFDTLKNGFIKLRDKYTQSTATVSALKDELNTCRGESEKLGVQVTALQEELRMQHEMMTVRINILEPSLQWIYSSIVGYAGGALCHRFLVSPPAKTLSIDIA